MEPVSPELVLVTPGLRSLLVNAWQDEDVLKPRSQTNEQSPVTPDRPSEHIPVVVQFALYAGWQAVTGALFGFIAFAVFVALLLLKPFIAG